jgi:hypothetical protein
VVTICYHLLFLIRIQLKHEIIGETAFVPFDRLVERLCVDSEQLRQIGIE